MQFLNFTIIKLSLFLILGIITGFSFEIPGTPLFIFLGVLFLIFCSAFLRARRKLFDDVFFGICTWSLIFTLGVPVTYLHQPKNQANHYINIENPDAEIIQIRITESLKPNLYYEAYIAEVEKVFSEEKIIPAKGKILLSISKDSIESKLEPGIKLLVPNELKNIAEPLNPYRFNYRNYMQKQRVEKQLQLNKAEIQILPHTEKRLLTNISNFRERLIQNLFETKFNKDELAIMQALLLGQRQDISKEIYEEYAAAGAIHILAVSGLHVGIILLILNWLFKPLNLLRNGLILKTLLLIVLMWGFAILAGLSPSVVRAVTMFSFIAIGMQMRRKTSVLNSLFISLFILLLINPYFIFQVGFQLSYLAVFAIVTIQPKLFKLWKPRFKITKYFWGLLSVSIAAQIGVLPLSLFYFHQFPGLFFLSNLVVLPVLGIILGLGILVIVLAFLNFLPDFLANTYGKLISLMNQFIGWIAEKEEFVFTDIHFNIWQNLSAYLLIFFFILLIYQKSFKNLVFFLCGILLFQGSMLYSKIQNSSLEIIIFHKPRKTMIGIQKDEKLILYHNLEDEIQEEIRLKDYKTGSNIHSIEEKIIPDILNTYKASVLIVDSSAVYKLNNFEPDVVLLRNSPKINLERLIRRLNPKIIIADGSNYHSYVSRWAETAQKQKARFHHTGKNGAFRISTEP
ncbi:ComEC/Rec2 family competence protein [Salegentibacter salegens]|uniref:Competence protein ComEC n=1 Tax=Salegentibacter salegens TaxID=143223 RepID=A0A1M7N7D9_9FLAO|nr:ComEC/Rec2 family competence protein [Salegentibacter salegens]PRX45667.1 competence protein ComEC [Salegentibacter salegens]SHM99414.1 competence protein ComEC [Salegentibacter salegens]